MKKIRSMRAVWRGGGRGRLSGVDKSEEESGSDEIKGHREFDSPHTFKLSIKRQ